MSKVKEGGNGWAPPASVLLLRVLAAVVGQGFYIVCTAPLPPRWNFCDEAAKGNLPHSCHSCRRSPKHPRAPSLSWVTAWQ